MLPVVVKCCPLPASGSSCSLAAGLESLGLTDIRTLVRLMCLAAAGRAGLSTSPPAGPGASERPRGAAKASKPISCLAYLSTAVGCLASNSPNAAKLLVQLCTQVSHRPPPGSHAAPPRRVSPGRGPRAFGGCTLSPLGFTCPEDLASSECRHCLGRRKPLYKYLCEMGGISGNQLIVYCWFTF